MLQTYWGAAHTAIEIAWCHDSRTAAFKTADILHRILVMRLGIAGPLVLDRRRFPQGSLGLLVRVSNALEDVSRFHIHDFDTPQEVQVFSVLQQTTHRGDVIVTEQLCPLKPKPRNVKVGYIGLDPAFQNSHALHCQYFLTSVLDRPSCSSWLRAWR